MLLSYISIDGYVAVGNTYFLLQTCANLTYHIYLGWNMHVWRLILWYIQKETQAIY